MAAGRRGNDKQSPRPRPWVAADLDRRSHLTLCSTADLHGVTLHAEKKKKKEKIRNCIREMISCCTSRFSWTHARQRLGSGKAAVCCTVAEWRTLSRLPKARIPQETHTHESQLREGLDSVMGQRSVLWGRTRQPSGGSNPRSRTFSLQRLD